MKGFLIGILLVFCALLSVDAADPKPTTEKKVVCYYTNWSYKRAEPYNFTPDKFDPFLCTHIIYAFSNFGTSYNLVASDPDYDLKQRGYVKIIGLKRQNRNLKVMVGTGGWRKGSLGFDAITVNETTRREFAKNAVRFLRGYMFDGMDLNWQHPTFREGGTPQDKENYVLLAQTLREEFEKDAIAKNKPRLLLSIGISHHMKSLPAYDIRSFNIYTDFINVICYDYHFSYESAVNHHSPLYSLEDSEDYSYDANINVNYTINYFLELADPEKLVLGMPAYGRTYKLENPEETALGSYADGPGEGGPYTKEKGWFAYFEICNYIKNDNWTVVQTKPGSAGPYAYKGDQWVGFDDIEMIRHKTRYAKQLGLAGVMFWTVDYDDFVGACEDGKKFPLISAARDELFKDEREEMMISFPVEQNFPEEDSPRNRGVPMKVPNPTPVQPIRPVRPAAPPPSRVATVAPQPSRVATVAPQPPRTVCPTFPPQPVTAAATPPVPLSSFPRRRGPQMDVRGGADDGGGYSNLVGDLVRLIERAGGMGSFCKVLREAKSTYRTRAQAFNLIDKDGEDSMILETPNLKPLMLVLSNSSIYIKELNIYGKT